MLVSGVLLLSARSEFYGMLLFPGLLDTGKWAHEPLRIAAVLCMQRINLSIRGDGNRVKK